jgi:hypothetical protein
MEDPCSTDAQMAKIRSLQIGERRSEKGCIKGVKESDEGYLDASKGATRR